MELDEEISSGLYACIERQVPNHEIQDKIILELSMYNCILTFVAWNCSNLPI